MQFMIFHEIQKTTQEILAQRRWPHATRALATASMTPLPGHAQPTGATRRLLPPNRGLTLEIAAIQILEFLGSS